MAGRQPDGGAAALLDPALRAAMGLDDDAYGGPAADAVLLPVGKRGAKRRPARPAAPPPPQTRAERRALKSKDRKLASLQDERVRKARRTELLASLAATELAPEQQALLYGSGALGHKLSVRETLQRSIAESAMGVASGTLDAGVLSKHAALLGAAARGAGGKRSAVDDDKDDDEDGSDSDDGEDDSGSSDDDSDAAAAAAPLPRAPVSGAQPAAGTTAPAVAPAAGNPVADAAGKKAAAAAVSAPAAASNSNSDASSDDGAPADAAGARRRRGSAARQQPPSKRVRWATDVDDDADDGGGDSDVDDSDDDDDAMDGGDGGAGGSDSGSDGSESDGYADMAGGAWEGLGASDDDNDDDDDDGGDGDDDEEDEDDSDGDDDDATSPPPQSSRRAGAAKPAAPSQPSKFSFAVKLPGKSVAAAPVPAAAPEVAAAPAAPVEAEPAPISGVGATAPAPAAAVPTTADAANTPSVFQTGAIHEGDPALAKLRALRAANLAAAAGGGRAPQSTWRQAAPLGDGDDDGEGAAAAAAAAVDDGEERITRYVISEADAAAAAAARATARAGFTSAADAIAALERGGSGSNADDGTDDKAYWDAYDGKGGGKKGGGNKKKSGKSFGALSAGGDADADAVSDPFLAQAARWSADGSTVLPSAAALPPSNYSAYAPLPSSLARPVDVEAARRELPVVRAEGDILEAVAGSDVVLLCGETGSGKTTQVPQMLLEFGYATPPGKLAPIPAGDVGRDAARPHARFRGFPGRIVVTQPRRVAATAMAHRVAAELGVAVGPSGPVGYQVRYDAGTVGPGTRLKFATDGVLLREIAGDLLLRQYSVVIIDEAHERGVNSDVLLGLLSRSVALRNELAAQQAAELAAAGDGDAASLLASPSSLPLGPLKLVVMSATLRVDDFIGNDRLFLRPRYLPPAVAAGGGESWPPVVVVQARQFPVTAHFARVTNVGGDYVGEAVGKAAKIHARLPPGGILVFLAGSQEVEDAVRALRKRFDPRRKKRRDAAAAAAAAARPALEAGATAPSTADTDGAGESEGAAPQPADGAERGDAEDDDAEGDDDAPSKPPSSEGSAPDADGAAAAGDDDAAAVDESGAGPVHVLPLYALLPPTAQQRVFAPPPPGHRLIVVATNVAETSLTIPGIRYVIDAGRVKRRVFDLRSGTSRFEVGWVSRASADQRAGRAGRTGPGHAYRLYSSAVYGNVMAAWEPPEVTVTPAEGLVLTMKALGVPCVARFPFPTPPPPASLHAAIRSLAALGALVPRVVAPAAGGGGGAAPKPAAASDASTDAAAAASLSAIDAEELTPLGAQLARLPLAPHLGKMLVLAAAGGSASSSGGASLLDYAVALVAALAAGDPFLMPSLAGAGAGGSGGKGGAHDATAASSAAVAAAEGRTRSGGDGSDDEDDDQQRAAQASTTYRDLIEELKAEEEREQAEAARGGDGSSDEDGEGGASSGDPAAAAEKAALGRARAARHAAAAAHAAFRHPLSDALTLLRAGGAYAHALASGGPSAASSFARANHLREKALREGLQLRRQLHALIHGAGISSGESGDGDDDDGPLDDGGGDAAEEEERAEEGGDGGKPAPKSVAASGGGRRRRRAVPPFPLSLPPPSPAVETALRQLLAAGSLERVAKRAPPDDAAELWAAGRVPPGARRRMHPYVPASGSLAAPLFLHTRSALVADGGGGDANYSAGSPAYVVFTEVLTTPARAYMRVATAVEPGWLHTLAAGTPLVRWEPPLEHPPPAYEPATDTITAAATPLFGDRSWRLPTARIPFPVPGGATGCGAPSGPADTRLRVFARALLEGCVAPALGQWVPLLAAPPSALSKRAPQARCADLLDVLRRPPGEFAAARLPAPGGGGGGGDGGAGGDVPFAPVDSAAKLAAVWRRYPAYLLAEYRAWLQGRHADDVGGLWPAMVAESLRRWGAAAARR